MIHALLNLVLFNCEELYENCYIYMYIYYGAE